MYLNHSRILRSTALAGATTAFAAISLMTLPGCWDSTPCDPGEIVAQNQCKAAPPDAGNNTTASSGSSGSGGGSGTGAGAGGAGGATTGGRPAADMYSYKACTTDADCGGQTPTCTTMPPPPATANYCTKLPCELGAADTCPVGGACTDAFKDFGIPNFCAKN